MTAMGRRRIGTGKHGGTSSDREDGGGARPPCLSITVLSDKESWINAYLPDLVSSLTRMGHAVVWRHNLSHVRKGDIAFYLGCGQIIALPVLARNRHNLVVHESDLPHGKGWSPLTWQILEGKNESPVTLFEAEERVDSGTIYLRDVMRFDGTELVEDLRKKQAAYTIRMCLSFVRGYPGIVSKGRDQSGRASYYRKRAPEDSRLDPDKTIREQFNLLRVVDNERYPAYFELDGLRYTLTIQRG